MYKVINTKVSFFFIKYSDSIDLFYNSHIDMCLYMPFSCLFPDVACQNGCREKGSLTLYSHVLHEDKEEKKSREENRSFKLRGMEHNWTTVQLTSQTEGSVSLQRSSPGWTFWQSPDLACCQSPRFCQTGEWIEGSRVIRVKETAEREQRKKKRGRLRRMKSKRRKWG